MLAAPAGLRPYNSQAAQKRTFPNRRFVPIPDIAGTLSDHLRWWAGQRGAPAVRRGLLFVVLGLSLLLLLEPLRQPQPHLRHVG